MDVSEVRTMAIALRELVEATPAVGGSLVLNDDTMLAWDREDGFHLIPTGGEVVALTDEWVEYEGAVPVEGVTSVRQQVVLMASQKRR